MKKLYPTFNNKGRNNMKGLSTRILAIAAIAFLGSFHLTSGVAAYELAGPGSAATEISAEMAATECDCSLSSLTGVNVGTLLSNNVNGPVMRVVGPGVELPNAGPTLGSAGSAPRWNINFGANTIRVDFIQQPATYGAGSKFTFSNLNSTPPAGCAGTPHIIGMTVTTNKPGAIPYVVTAATFTSNSVTLPFAPSSGNIDWKAGEYIFAELRFACDTPPPSIDPCCPPWNSTTLANSMFYQGSGSFSQPYTLKFQPSATLNNQMTAYVAYTNALDPTVSSLKVTFDLWGGGTGSVFSSTGLVASGSANWTSSPGVTLTPGGFYNGFPMVVNTWYRVLTVPTFNQDRPLTGECNKKFWIDVRIQVAPGRQVSPGIPPILQIRLPDGRIIEKAVQTK